ncbi:DUF3221 domain-containing protein [Bacillus sp. V59.32b]|uniref:DUF3221 domain-containing protein n=1 Tax=Bacillus sp. V59.32b TaxID=1758642 RepID=UPI000E3BFA72|nr:DUF3221 domain-containing protein [Bacillus sp. V59.32b]RFU69191.1 hypothetical protein D0463_03040 [Bacillus sp. V59.32b]
MARVILLLHVFVCILLAGCSLEFGTHNEAISIGAAGFITDLADGESVLIKNTYYTLSEDTSIKDSDGEELSFKDLEIGMKAKVWYEGDLKESIPSRADARLIMIQKDRQSLTEQKVVASAISFLQEGESQRFFVRKVTYLAAEKAYQLEMMSRSNTDASFFVTVDELSYEIIYQD